jgi:3-carboxy-cis,cis-muconate cycloisomerase
VPASFRTRQRQPSPSRAAWTCSTWLRSSATHSEPGTLAIPLVQQLVARVPPDARPYIHWGATSQDAIDTALVLQMREGIARLVDDLVAIGESLAALADAHRKTVMPGRTLLQQAVPITFGLKAARWLSSVARLVVTLRRLRHESLVLQFGGAAGTLAALGEHGSSVARFLAAELELELPDLPWHAERDRPASVVVALGVGAGVIAKIARDLVLLAQTEVAEVVEAFEPGKGTSSAMPQKRNPVEAVNAIALRPWPSAWFLSCSRRCHRSTSAASAGGRWNGLQSRTRSDTRCARHGISGRRSGHSMCA